MADWWDLAGDVGSWWLKRRQSDDSTKQAIQGTEEARKDIKSTMEPYQDFAKWGMGGYQDMGPFSYSLGDYLQSPYYQWEQEQAAQGVQRSAAAGQGVLSGATLAQLSDRAANIGAQRYQEDWQRKFQEHGENRAYWGMPVSVGAQTADAYATSLGNLQVARGNIRAGATSARQQSTLDLLKEIGIFGTPAQGNDPAVSAGAQIAKEAYEAAGGLEGTGKALKDWVSEIGGGDPLAALKQLGSKLGDATGLTDVSNWVSNLGATKSLLGPSTGLSQWGVNSQAAMLAEQMADFGPEGLAMTKEALMANMEGATAAVESSLGSKALQFLASPAGIGVIAGVGTLLMTKDIKASAITGGGAYIGSLIASGIAGGPIGLAIGGALGGAIAQKLGMGGGYAKADSAMMFSPPGAEPNFKDGTYAVGEWGAVGFKAGSTRHMNAGKYQAAFDAVVSVDNAISSSLTSAENEAMVAAITGEQGFHKFRKKRNEGKITPKKVARSTLRERQKMLQQILTPERYAELNIQSIYDTMIQNI